MTRIHRKVWLWNPVRWFAAQMIVKPYVSLGLHVDFARPYVDLHFLLFIVSVGKNPVVTNEWDRTRGSCRGFTFSDSALL